MKKIIALVSVLALVISMTGCSKKDTATNTNTSGTDNTQQTDVSGAFVEDVDLEKVEGEAATSTTDKAEYAGKMGDYEVSIGGVKVIDYEEEKIAVVEIEYKNKSSQEMAFSAALVAAAYQNGNELSEAMVVGVEGVEVLAMTERVAPGDKITVQKTYKLKDESAMTVEIRPFAAAESDEVLTKEFNF